MTEPRTLRDETIVTLSRIQQLADFALDDPTDRQATALRGISVRAGQLLTAYGIVQPSPDSREQTAAPVEGMRE